MVVLTTLNSAPCARAQKLSSDSFTAHCDLEVRAGGATYPAHRAVLALHSAFFRSYATPNNAHGIDGEGGFGVFAPSKAVLELSVARAPDPAVQAGWDVVYKYCYGHRVALDTAAALHATRVAREYRFDELAVVLDAYLRGGGVDPKRCTQVFAAAVGAARGGGAGVGNTTSRSHDADVVDVVRRAAWRVLKERFSQVQGWRNVPWAYMVRLVKLNDLVVQSEMQVWHAVEEWCADEDDGTAVAGLAKLVRFPTMTREELAEVERAPLLKRHPTVARYVRRGIVACENEAVGGARRTVPLLDSSPVYRRRRPDALTFTDHIPAWSTLAQPVHTSTRYFAGALWRIVVDPAPTAVGLYVAVLSEESQGDVDVAVDFSVFVVAPHENGRLVKKQANNVHFSRSGQRAGFACVLSRADLEEKDTQSSLVTNDTLYIGASIRIRGKHAPSNEPIAGFDATSDDTAELISF